MVRFPMDNPDPSKRGMEQQVRIDLVDRRSKELPELNDDFAKTLGDFDGIETLRTRIQSDMEAEAKGEADAAVNTQLLDWIVDANPFEVPQSMVERYIETVLGDVSKADPDAVAKAREEIRPEAERGVKRVLVIDGVADAQALMATPEDIEERLARIAESSKTTTAKARAALMKANRLESFVREITERKVIEYLRGQSDIQEGES
jgi:trigger factor